MDAVTGHFSRKFIGAVEDEWQLYSNNSSDYTIGPTIGFGASSIVYAALYQPAEGGAPIPCALKVLDLDRLPPSALRLLQNETQLMSLSKHPNVLRVRGSWVDGHKLHIAMRLMNAGSVADVMRYAWPGGLEEEVIRCILKQALEGINYLHINCLMHRDVKAANLLVDDDGTVLLGDLGVAAFLWDREDSPAPQTTKSRIVNFNAGPHPSHRHPHSHSRPQQNPPLHRPPLLGKRKSFVGTPCWMAPEVINGKQYDASADIWSFGITAIELAQGRAPRSRMDPHKVLVMTVTDEPPKLERNTGPNHYSSAFVEVVAMCLTKDPSKRPTAEALLQMSFFKGARKPSYLCSTILRGMPPLTQRQERRKQPSLLTHATMDSWDFSASLPSSPTTSVFGRQPRPRSAVPPGSVFEIEDSEGGDERGPSLDTGALPVEDTGDDAALEGHSKAEAYVQQVRAQHRSGHSRGLLARSCSGSSQSIHAARRHLDDGQHYTIDSIEEGAVAIPAADGYATDGERGDEGLPVVGSSKSAELAMLHVPLAPPPSTSPSGSSRSSGTATSSSSPSGPSTPPQSFLGTAKAQPARLWRKLAGKFDLDADKEKESASGSKPPTPTLKKAFGSVLGRSASRTMSNAKPAQT